MRNQKKQQLLVIFAGFAMLFSGLTAGLFADGVGPTNWEDTWEAGVYTGFMTGGEVFNVKIDGEPVMGDVDGGWLFGGRLGADSEYFGWEAHLAGVFTDVELREDENINTSPASEDASWLLTGIDVMVYPTGNYLNDGRIRPFISAGPGAAFFFSDFDEVDSGVFFDLNAGVGVKFLLGDEGKQILRLDWKYHFMNGGSDFKNNQYYQELTLGLGISF